MEKGTLYVVATPIGNIEDITERAKKVLGTVAIIACEDTRKTGVFLARIGIEKKRMISYFEGNETRRAQEIVRLLEKGEDVALVTNAGTPCISDPGYRVVHLAREHGIRVVPVPGPCSVVAALCASGLPTDRFSFYGFLPKKRKRFFESLSGDKGTLVFFVPAREGRKVLEELDEVFPDCDVVIAREMTKVFEEFIYGKPKDCISALEEKKAKGEITLLLSFPKQARKRKSDKKDKSQCR
jgi:16S rRNA (cytidine1402-2'-O)-methyltransferase